MKKLMIALAAVAVAAGVQAASFNWKTSMSGKVYSPTDTTALLAGTFDAYIFEATAVSQSSLVSAYAAGTLDLASSSISTTKGSLSNGAIGSTALSYGDVGGTYSLYFAAIVTEGSDEYLFISNVASAQGQEGKTPTVNINGKATDVFDVASGYQGAGYYNTAAVPEPTSGLLMLLGMAGLALRRHRA